MSEMVPMYGFSGGGGVVGTLTVTAPAGVTVTVSKDGKTKTKVAGSDGIAVFKGLASGEWMVTITNGSQTAQKTVTITTGYAISISFNTIPEFTYTGDFEIVNDSDEPITTSQDNWKIRFLTSGTLTFTELNGADNGIDVFLVGGGGNGGNGSNFGSSSYSTGGGGGGGYTNTEKSITVDENVKYDIVVGGATGSSSGFNFKANGGASGTNSSSSTNGTGGNGGSGGGSRDGAGGTNGGDGTGQKPGKGQGSTTREFAESTGKLYARGGNVGSSDKIVSGAANTGNGGGGAHGTRGGGDGTGKKGGSGIVIIRNARG